MQEMTVMPKVEIKPGHRLIVETPKGRVIITVFADAHTTVEQYPTYPCRYVGRSATTTIYR